MPIVPQVKDGALRLIDCELTQLPAWINDNPARYGRSVRTLVLKANMLAEVPDVRGLERLTELNLNGNELSYLDAASLPPTIERLEAINNHLSSMHGVSR